MPSLDSLPGDQRAVLQLVLGRGRSYDEIARLLSINASAVRDRALRALDSLGPQTSVSAENQAKISDYLLGQLSDEDAAGVRDLLAGSPSDRAWARVLSSELAPLAADPLPEIPLEGSASEPEPVPEPVALTPPPPADPGPQLAARIGLGPAEEQPREKKGWGRRRRERGPSEPPPPTSPDFGAPPDSGAPRSSRLGGMIVIVAGVVVVAAVLVVVLTGGSSKNHTNSTPTTTTIASSSSSAAGSSTTTSSTSSNAGKVLAQINLTPPTTGTASKAVGIAEVLSEGTTNGIAIVAQNIAPNTTKPPNAYAVWLYNSPTDAKILGFVNPGVTKTGRLSTAGPLPTNAKHYKQLIVTLETTGQPKTPGTIVLQGTMTGL